MPHRLPRPARLAISCVKLAVLGTIVAVGVAGPWPTTPQGHQSGYVVQPVVDRPDPTARPDRTERLLDAHSCSTTGFGTDQQPLSAVIQSASGELRFVDFDTGWRVYTRHGVASLVAVCLDEPPS